MIPFLIATLLALLIVGVLVQTYRQGDRRGFRRALISAALFIVLFASYAVWISGGKLSRTDANAIWLGESTLIETAGSYRVTGVAGNRSPDQVITSLPLELTVENCTADDHCQPVFRGTRELLVTISPGDSVPYTAVFTADPAPADGKRRWYLKPGAPKAHAP